jgi:hypothetical protein
MVYVTKRDASIFIFVSKYGYEDLNPVDMLKQ